MKLGTHNLHANTHVAVEQIVKILLVKFLVKFLNFKFEISLWNGSSSRAIMLSYNTIVCISAFFLLTVIK